MDLQIFDQNIEKLLVSATNIAIVGLSPKEERASNMVARYLQQNGYQIFPVNPGHVEILGVPCYKDLQEIPQRLDIVNIFRRPEDTPAIVEQAISRGARAIWMQLGVVNEAAALLAKKAGIPCYMDLCIKIEHARFITS